MRPLRKLILPAFVVACGGLSACTTTPARTTQSLAPKIDGKPAANGAQLATQTDGSTEDGARSLAYEVERNSGKQARVRKKVLPGETTALPAATTPEQEIAQPETDDQAAATGEVTAQDAALPMTAMLPEPRPTGIPLAASGAQVQPEPVQVASLDPSIGVASERFGSATPDQPTRPMAVDAVEDMAEAPDDSTHSKPAPDGRFSAGNVEARSPELDQLIAQYANYYGVPEKLVRRVAKRESTFNPKARNGIYMGLMQISPATARGMGFRGATASLLDAETNLKYAVRYLRGAYIVARGNHDKADRLYQTGYYYHAKRAGLLDETGVGKDRKRRRSRL